MVMTEARPEVSIMRAAIRCTGTKKDGRLCNHLLCKVDIERWEETLTDARQDVCEGCGRVYTLAEYR